MCGKMVLISSIQRREAVWWYLFFLTDFTASRTRLPSSRKHSVWEPQTMNRAKIFGWRIGLSKNHVGSEQRNERETIQLELSYIMNYKQMDEFWFWNSLMSVDFSFFGYSWAFVRLTVKFIVRKICPLELGRIYFLLNGIKLSSSIAPCNISLE